MTENNFFASLLNNYASAHNYGAALEGSSKAADELKYKANEFVIDNYIQPRTDSMITQAEERGISEWDGHDSLVHAYTNALFVKAVDITPSAALNIYDYPEAIVKYMGDSSEARQRGGRIANGTYDPKAEWQDHWNNQVGRQIGAYAEKHDLSDQAIIELVLAAHQRNDLIVLSSDARIPEVSATNPHELVVPMDEVYELAASSWTKPSEQGDGHLHAPFSEATDIEQPLVTPSVGNETERSR